MWGGGTSIGHRAADFEESTLLCRNFDHVSLSNYLREANMVSPTLVSHVMDAQNIN